MLSILDAQVADVDRHLGELVALRAELVARKTKVDRLPAEEGCYCRIVEHAEMTASAPRAVRGLRR